MGGYISVLKKNYNIPVYNENQYADLYQYADLFIVTVFKCI